MAPVARSSARSRPARIRISPAKRGRGEVWYSRKVLRTMDASWVTFGHVETCSQRRRAGRRHSHTRRSSLSTKKPTATDCRRLSQASCCDLVQAMVRLRYGDGSLESIGPRGCPYLQLTGSESVPHPRTHTRGRRRNQSRRRLQSELSSTPSLRASRQKPVAFPISPKTAHAPSPEEVRLLRQATRGSATTSTVWMLGPVVIARVHDEGLRRAMAWALMVSATATTQDLLGRTSTASATHDDSPCRPAGRCSPAPTRRGSSADFSRRTSPLDVRAHRRASPSPPARNVVSRAEQGRPSERLHGLRLLVVTSMAQPS